MRAGVIMIVKNEAAVIERSLRSALKFLDTWCIVDTGSTDTTMDIIRSVAEEFGKPGFLYQKPWVNFGHNRTEAFRLAKEHMDWGWVLDADDSIEGEDYLERSLLEKDTQSAYRVTVSHGGMVQQRPQLFNLKFPWEYVGAVHEYANCPGHSHPTECLPTTIRVVARTEGCRSQDPQKYANDAKLLQTELDTNPATDRARTLFYLAQSYKDSGQIEKAIQYYTLRAEFPGWIEENYISFVNLIQLTTDLKKKLEYAWRAQDAVPERREAVYEVLTWCRARDLFKQEVFALGYAFKDVKMNSAHLFVSQVAYSWKYVDELGVIAYYTSHPAVALECTQKALQMCNDMGQIPRLQKNVEFAQMKT